MKSFFLLLSALVFGSLSALAAECETPTNVIDTMGGMYPDAYVYSEGDFTANDGSVWYTMIFRADQARTDMLFIFEYAEGDQVCFVDAMEIVKVDTSGS